jgi:hypothetical protein
MTNQTTYVKRRIGIQPGTCATDEKARQLDSDCKGAAQVVLSLLKDRYPNLKFEKKLSKQYIPGGLGACAPDGGVWFDGDKLVAAFEAKKQGNGGNAIERWFKNNYICRNVNPNVFYVTFATGPGACIEGVIHKTLNVAHLSGVNKLVPKSNSLFLQPNGFTKDEIIAIMVETLESALS